MSKKKLFDVEAIKKILERGKTEKAISLLCENKIDQEGSKYLLESGVFYNINLYNNCENAKPQSYFYKDFEEYINSNLANTLFEKGDSGNCAMWFDLFPSTSAELMYIYNNSSQRVKEIIFKTICYRKRTLGVNKIFAEKYLNCFDAIYEIVKIYCEKEGKKGYEILNYLFSWAYVINPEWIDKAKTKLEISNDIKMILTTRIETRYGCDNENEAGLLEEKISIFKYIKENNISIDIFPYIWQNLRLSKTKDNEKTIELKQVLYDTFISEKISSNVEDFDEDFLKDINNMTFLLMPYEQDEDKLNCLFNLGILRSKSYSNNPLGHFVKDMCSCSEMKKIKITSHMETTTKIFGTDFKDFLTTKEFLSIKEVKELKNKYLPYDTYLGNFNSNHYLSDAINLLKYSEDDFKELSYILDWTNVDKYFYKERVPLEFIEKYGTRIKNLFSILYYDLENYMEKDINKYLKVIDLYSHKFSTIELKKFLYGIMSNGASSEVIASFINKLTSRNPHINLCENLNNFYSNKKASVKEIISLI